MLSFHLDIVPKGSCVPTVLLVTASNRPAMPVTQWDVSQTLKGSSLFDKFIYK